MRYGEYKQVSTRTEHRVIHHEAEYDEDGNITSEAWDETVDVEVPVMGMVYRDATPEEIAELEAMHEAMPEPQPTLEDCQAVADMAYVNSELALAMLNEMEV